MIGKSNRHRTKLTLFTWVNSLCMPIFNYQSKWHGKVLYREKTKVLVIYKIDEVIVVSGNNFISVC